VPLAGADDCPTGKFSKEGDASCTACPPGKYQDLPRQTDCKLAPVGNYTDQFGLGGPRPCKRRSIAPAAGSSVCFACSDSSDSTPEGDICICPAGFYAESPDASTNTSVVQCLRCARGAYCDRPGVSWNTLQSDAGRTCPLCVFPDFNRAAG
jgi:hypothetical protein